MNISKRTLLKGLAAAPVLASPALVLTEATKAAAQMDMTSAQVPGYYRYSVGDIEVTALLDGTMALPDSFVLGYDEAAARVSTAQAYRKFTPGAITIPVNGYVINSGGKLTLIDAGAPTLLGETVGGLTGNLEAAGFKPEEIDTVLFTHFHPDHIGALLNAQGGKTFANAGLVCAEAEWNFAHDDAVRNAAPDEFKGMIDMVRGFVAPYADGRNMFNGEKEVVSGVTSMPLPGHTPGHTGYSIHAGDESLLIWGDIIHFSTLQFAHPNWGVVFDTDPAMASETRRKMLDRASADRMAVAGMHIDFPGIGYVERAGDTYRHIVSPWQL